MLSVVILIPIDKHYATFSGLCIIVYQLVYFYFQARHLRSYKSTSMEVIYATLKHQTYTYTSTSVWLGFFFFISLEILYVLLHYYY